MEVCLSIGIIAIVFVSILGLLPAGMQVFDATIDANAQARITAHLVGTAQAGEYAKLIDVGSSNTLYYYDSDGGFLDSKPTTSPAAELKRTYVARMVPNRQRLPGAAEFDLEKTSVSMKFLMAKYNATTVETLSRINDFEAPLPPGIKSQARLIARMEGEGR